MTTKTRTINKYQDNRHNSWTPRSFYWKKLLQKLKSPSKACPFASFKLNFPSLPEGQTEWWSFWVYYTFDFNLKSNWIVSSVQKRRAFWCHSFCRLPWRRPWRPWRFPTMVWWSWGQRRCQRWSHGNRGHRQGLWTCDWNLGWNQTKRCAKEFESCVAELDSVWFGSSSRSWRQGTTSQENCHRESQEGGFTDQTCGAEQLRLSP